MVGVIAVRVEVQVVAVGELRVTVAAAMDVVVDLGVTGVEMLAVAGENILGSVGFQFAVISEIPSICGIMLLV